MLYIRSSCITYFIAFCFAILEILRNSRTHGESWGFRYFHIWVFSNFENRIICFNYFSLRKYFISKYMRGDKMTSPQIMKYWRKNIKNKYLILFGFYLNQEFFLRFFHFHEARPCPLTEAKKHFVAQIFLELFLKIAIYF